ncbi:hypothetical protein EN836_08165 [Mesorhizobium sp. M1C.F.Ca.ET.193.01.1.1]|uniref:DUF6492 family protein n=2 Tax=Mesorhizobium TaxID=68287 RepID=UPI000FD5205B|nr:MULTISPECIES: DUF6492 family protein [unclassified Mesorhizobium]TGT02378.1 hypothetical protein EN820_24935 [bacterium M00.F.Ca.ET.177.01.1.1]TGQ55063.1 hypothetical protein EN853_07410 [Mesorhizobium sp. M1C.F.Ca.ET.210.01.1.1]TGQ73708.1 hypothetical protein EN855_007420 [Mesorhizobium sp. M1C.F.Ca.ET.212.01.1.1]TGR12483.1 hypothetical protein EN847_08165 [Mesorhizobium sp. M1C.F.Ca.ET.204.01.1.1]TGR31723.1 hypothetical protein EN839_07415 [Mesorhizobium sp. M1C.F.Ca.ET.196.01.1.1]
MNSRFVPDAAARIEPLPLTPSAAVVTASYAPDFERCRLLCETMDRHVTGVARHYILVEHRDVALFRQLEGSRRTVVDERDLLPRWLRVFDDPLSLFHRRVWLSFRTQPLRGWHVQQLRRIAVAAHAGEDVLVFCDSDVAFLKPFDAGAFWRDGKARLFRRDGVLANDGHDEHRIWSRNAGSALGIDPAKRSADDYISTLIAWRRETVNAMCERIEKAHGRDWVSVVGSARKFSECMIYGRYVDDVLAGAGHFHDSVEFCRVHWNGEALSDEEFCRFVDAMAPEQVAIGMQSFIGTDVARIRRLIGVDR